METSNTKGLVIIPYRDRATHLECLVSQLQRHWDYLTICVCEQADENYWNKGLLYNVGFKFLALEYDYIVLHDVDFIPVVDQVDYSFCENPTMIAGAASQFNYRLLYPTFFGGVVVCSKEHYEIVNGFSNLFKGYGGEDDSFRSSFVQKGIQSEVKMGRFECFSHPRPDNRPGTLFYNSSEYQHNLKLATSSRNFQDGLSTINKWYDRIDIDRTTNNYIHIKVKTHGR